VSRRPEGRPYGQCNANSPTGKRPLGRARPRREDRQVRLDVKLMWNQILQNGEPWQWTGDRWREKWRYSRFTRHTNARISSRRRWAVRGLASFAVGARDRDFRRAPRTSCAARGIDRVTARTTYCRRRARRDNRRQITVRTGRRSRLSIWSRAGEYNNDVFVPAISFV